MNLTTIQSEGSLISADLLSEIYAATAAGQRAADFGLDGKVRLSDEIAASWSDARAYWEAFQHGLRRIKEGETGATATRELWILPLLRTLGFDSLTFARSAAFPLHETRSYDEHYEWLKAQTDNRSNLERDFLAHLYREGRRLPDHAQKNLPDYPSRPDFYYEDGHVCVFCDGSIHDAPEQRQEDERVRGELLAKGYRVIVVRYDRSLTEQVQEHEDVFGVLRE